MNERYNSNDNITYIADRNTKKYISTCNMLLRNGKVRFNYTHSQPRRYNEVGVQKYTLTGLSPGKETRCPLYRRMSRLTCQSGLIRQISPSPWLEPHTVKPVASRYTDYIIPAAPK
jgi:hypothetical protein